MQGRSWWFGETSLHDNLRVRKAPGLAELVEKHGARLLFLPPYSPDFTPVELTFSKLEPSCARPRSARGSH